MCEYCRLQRFEHSVNEQISKNVFNVQATSVVCKCVIYLCYCTVNGIIFTENTGGQKLSSSQCIYFPSYVVKQALCMFEFLIEQSLFFKLSFILILGAEYRLYLLLLMSLHIKDCFFCIAY